MRRKQFVIAGVTLSGNMGGSAMLVTTLQQLRIRFPGAQFQLLSVYPAQDRLLNVDPDLEIVPTPPLALLGWYLPLSLLCLLSNSLRTLLARYATFFRVVSSSDAIIDLSGIAFVDGRGLPLLFYNMACAIPGAAFGKPVFKLSQALGPFRGRLNRILARFTLRRCVLVVARGLQSYTYLQSLGLPRIRVLPDVSFAMAIPATTQQAALDVYKRLECDFEEWIVLSPSEVVNRLCERRNIDLLGELERFVDMLLKTTDAGILILPHSLGLGESKNNDVALCQRLYERFAGSSRIRLFISPPDPILLRALIGHGTFFVGCRFHAVVAALATSVPALILGWSHKYEEMAEAFGSNIPSMDFSDFSAGTMFALFEASWNVRDKTKAELLRHGNSVRKQSLENFSLIEVLMSCHYAD